MDEDRVAALFGQDGFGGCRLDDEPVGCVDGDSCAADQSLNRFGSCFPRDDGCAEDGFERREVSSIEVEEDGCALVSFLHECVEFEAARPVGALDAWDDIEFCIPERLVDKLELDIKSRLLRG